jgi:hypothetical protein
VAGDTKVSSLRIGVDFFDQLSDGDNGDSLSLAHLEKLRQSKKFAVVTDHFTNHCDGFESCQLHELDRSLGVTGTFFDPSGCRFEGNYVSGSNQ